MGETRGRENTIPGIAKNVERRRKEAACVVVSGDGPCRELTAANTIRYVAVSIVQGARDARREGEASHINDNSARGPSSQSCVCQAIPMTAELFVASEGEFIYIAEGEPLRRIESRGSRICSIEV